MDIISNLNDIPQWKEFSELEKANIIDEDSTSNNPMLFNPTTINNWGQKYYGPSKKQIAGWFLGGAATTASIIGIAWYFKNK